MCMTQTIQGAKLMVLSLAFDGYLTQEELTWAANTVKGKPDYTVILLTHNFASDGGVLNTKIQKQVVDPNSNVKMVLCGHLDGAAVHKLSNGGFAVLQDYQGESGGIKYGGSEFMRLIQFDVENDLVYFNTYSPMTGETLSPYGSAKDKAAQGLYQKNGDEFALSVALNGDKTRSFTTGSLTLSAGQAERTNTASIPEGQAASFSAADLKAGQTYLWHVVLTDSSGNTTVSPAAAFTAPKAEDSSNGGHGTTGGSGSSSAKTFTLTFDTNGGNAIDKVTKASGTIVDLAAYQPTRDGYVFAGWCSDKALTKTVTSVKLTANTTVYAKWTQAGTADTPFTDVDADDYFYDAVLWAVQEKITTGMTDTLFGPEESCTRAQMVTFLWRAAGEPEVKDAENPFTDVKSSDYYYDAVLWAVEQGITNGMTATTFGPEVTVTRDQTVTFLWRAAGKPLAENAQNPFTDVKEGAYYYDAVLWAVEQKITTGMSATTFGPEEDCTRGQIVTFLYRSAEQG